MARLRKIGMAVGTFSVALGIGFVMQNGDALANKFSLESAPDQPAPFTEAVGEAATILSQSTLEVPVSADNEGMAIPVAQSGMVLASSPEIIAPAPVLSAAVILPETAKVILAQEAPIQLAALDSEPAPVVGSNVAGEVAIDCAPSIEATVGAAASVGLAVVAPCYANSPFTIHHQGMMFTAMTDDVGEAELVVPALAEDAVMIAVFDGGDGAVVTATVQDFANFDRVVLQWQGDVSVMLSAYEDDAKFGDDNHIHADNPGDIDRLEMAVGGYLVRLGDGSVSDGLMAEVYTFPTGMMGTAPDVMLVAEAEITSVNCGQELNVQSIQVFPNGDTAALDLTMIMPECDAVGDFLILQNMFEDLTLASR
ncbi:hypothetical protein OAN307_c46610 [Octadecabacter antarcticus 307]|uniref:Translocase n=1 Tax=Octadecabacter antarcticus 307 TaxID=391626 RepID=M9RJL3_9RHOB|nr:hypothetical protein [Octadecabacter antarcticus]AGI70010.1 hypothetical protein OAN307_c46610 [Octadecabacter antarcticus 307]